MKPCTTHHMCDCIEAALKKYEKAFLDMCEIAKEALKEVPTKKGSARKKKSAKRPWEKEWLPLNPF